MAEEEQGEEHSQREKMFEAELTNQQLAQLQEYLERIGKQQEEVAQLKAAIDEYGTVRDGDDLLVPIAAGMFLKAKATADKRFLVNSGQGVVVEKTIPEVHALLDKQLSEMREYEKDLQGQFDKLLSRLQEIQEEFDQTAQAAGRKAQGQKQQRGA